MPLKAIHDNASVLAPLLSDEEWQLLRDQTRAGGITLILPCCQTAFLTRESKLGTRHFYHKRGAECSSKGETAEHLLAKALVLQGCQDAGWTVDAEVAGDDWRADVLANNGKHRVAFEIQWSSQTLDETESRQQRYADDAVRCAWLFRRLPKKAVPSKDLPMFQMDFADRANPSVEGMPVRTFAKSMLAGDFRFSEIVKSAPTQTFPVDFFEYTCYRCKKDCHVFLADRFQNGLRSVHGEPIASLDEGFVNGVDACQELLDLQEKLSREDGGRLLLGKMTRRPGKTMNYSSLSQDCPHCNAIFGKLTLWTNLLYETPVLTREVTAICTKPIRIAEPHWCHSVNKDFCN